MELSELLATFRTSAPFVSWFLGSGASIAAGIPSAYDLIEDFKLTLYRESELVSPNLFSDLSNPSTRNLVNRCLEAKGLVPEPGDDPYAYYFEKTHGDEAMRRTKIQTIMEGKKPTYGHKVLAVLAHLQRLRIIWTTNFDKLPEDALFQVYGTSKHTVAQLGEPDVARQAINGERWPVVVKLHGDFSSERLKNTAEELRTQDHELRKVFVDTCSKYGLVVVGYSGRDESVMDALEAGLHGGKGYPHGLFWIQRGSNTDARVTELISKARALKIKAGIIKLDTFNELAGEIIKQIILTDEFKNYLRLDTPVRSSFPTGTREGQFPLIRLNALPLAEWPKSCRILECKFNGGTKMVKENIASKGAKLIAIKKKNGIAGFGLDADFKAAFAEYEPGTCQDYPIQSHRLLKKYAELNLLYEAIGIAFMRERGLTVERRHGSYWLVPMTPPSPGYFDKLKASLPNQQLSGSIPGTGLRWYEAVVIKLEYRFDRLWLILEPTIYADRPQSDLDRERAKEFCRKRANGRYNNLWNQSLDAWVEFLVGRGKESSLSALGLEPGHDASFKLHGVTAFSGRAS